MTDAALANEDPLDAAGLSLRSGAAEVFLVRHADAIPDAATRPAETQYDSQHLSERGRTQAAAVAARFAGSTLAAVYASPVTRARETAEPVAREAGVRVREDAALVEVRIGDFAAPDGVREHLMTLAAIALRTGTWSGIPGTEPTAGVRRRMLDALSTIARAHGGRRVVVVSHAGAINATLAAILGTGRDFPFPLANASISTVRINGERRLVMSANETTHLRGVPPRGAR
ncbi:MAG: histidine phosphatase family protein [Candidatus Velthaea sp.]